MRSETALKRRGRAVESRQGEFVHVFPSRPSVLTAAGHRQAGSRAGVPLSPRATLSDHGVGGHRSPMATPCPRLGRGGEIKRASPKASTLVHQAERMGGKRLGSITPPMWIREGLISQSAGRRGTEGACAAGLGRATTVHPIAEAEQAGCPGSGAAGSQGALLTAVWSIRASQCGIPAGAMKAAIAGAAPRSARTATTIVTCLRRAAHMHATMAQGCQSFNCGQICILLAPAGK